MGNIYFGSPDSQPAKIIFDTGSPWLTVTSDLCDQCEEKAYFVKNSTTQKQISQEKENLIYGSLDLKGYYYSDLVCLSPIQKSLD